MDPSSFKLLLFRILPQQWEKQHRELLPGHHHVGSPTACRTAQSKSLLLGLILFIYLLMIFDSGSSKWAVKSETSEYICYNGYYHMATASQHTLNPLTVHFTGLHSIINVKMQTLRCCASIWRNKKNTGFRTQFKSQQGSSTLWLGLEN